MSISKSVATHLRLQQESMKFLGQGTYAKVYFVKGTDGISYALKVIEDKDLFKEREWEVLNEMRDKSPYLIKAYAKAEEGKRLFIKMELANDLSIQQILAIPHTHSGMKSGTIDIMWQILSGLSVLHANGFIHRDLKPENIMLMISSEGSEERLICKITDFGFARPTDKHGHAATVLGAPLYMAPEILKAGDGGTPYTNACDIWSCGLIFYQLVTKGQHPFQTASNPYMISLLQTKPILRPPALKPNSAERGEGYLSNPAALDMCWELIDRMLRYDPTTRPTAAEAMGSALFQQWGPPEARAHTLPVVLPPTMHPSLAASTVVALFGAGPNMFPKYTEVYRKFSHKNRFQNGGIKEFTKTETKTGIRHQILFVMDATGSMIPYIDAVRKKIANMVEVMIQSSHKLVEGLKKSVRKVDYQLFFEIACVCYRDYEDSKQFETLDFTEDTAVFNTFLANINTGGGGDMPEDVLGAFLHALYGLDAQTPPLSWEARGEVAKRSVVYIADAPQHGFADGKKDDHPDDAMEPYWQIIFKTLSVKNMSLTVWQVNDSCTSFHKKLVELGKFFNVVVNVVKDVNPAAGGGGGGGDGGIGDLYGGLEDITMLLSSEHSVMTRSAYLTSSGRFIGEAGMRDFITELVLQSPSQTTEEFVTEFSICREGREPNSAELTIFLALANAGGSNADFIKAFEAVQKRKPNAVELALFMRTKREEAEKKNR